MLDHKSETGPNPVDEFALRDTLRDLRKDIPDKPWLNPITSVAFDLSRRLESGDISFNDLKAVAGRLLDRACVNRARWIRERVAFDEHATTLKEFAAFLMTTMGDTDGDTDGDIDASFETFKQRWSRARNGVVLTAHPTFALSDALTRRMVEIAVANDTEEEELAGHAHRPDDGVTLAYEHARAQDGIQKLRSGYEELLNTFFSVAAAHYGERAYKMKPQLATLASWVGYDLDGRTDITWLDSFVLRLQEKRAGLSDIRERFLAIKHRLGENPDTQRVCRQITGKLDLAIAAVEEQIKALDKIGDDRAGLSRAANIITRPDSSINGATETML